MTRVFSRLIPLVVLLSLWHLGFEAKACTCDWYASVYEEYQASAAVFVGKAIGRKDVRRVAEGRTFEVTETIYQFAVTEAFKGVTTPTVDIEVGQLLISCPRGFGIGETYLVYATRFRENALGSGYCSRTTRLSNAASDLHYIRELLRGVREPRVYGSVVRREREAEDDNGLSRKVPLESFKILIEGEGKRLEVDTDRRGLYRLDDLPDGKYKVSPLLTDDRHKIYLWSFHEFTLGSSDPSGVNRDSRKAVTVDFDLAWNNELHGRIVDAEGTPITHARVAVLLRRDARFKPTRYAPHFFDGEFSFHGLTPGRYRLSVTIKAPFEDKAKATTFYYPTTDQLERAELFEIGLNQKFEGKDFKLPPGYVVRRVTGVLVYPDGEPASGSSKALLGVSKDSDEKDACDTSFTDKDGRFSLQGFVGADYWIYGTNESAGKGDAIKIKLAMTNEPLKIVIPFPKK